MNIWKDLKNAFSGKDPNQAFKERMQQEQQQVLDSKDKEGVRDKIIGSKDFFTKQIDQVQKRIIQMKQEYDEDKALNNPDFDFSVYFTSFNIKYSQLIRAKYSRGDGVKTIFTDCAVLMETVTNFWTPDMDYSDGGDMNLMALMDAISLGILANIDNDAFKELGKVMQEKEYKDFIIDYLINSRFPDYPIGEELQVPDSKSLQLLSEIIKEKNKSEAVKKLKLYLDKYYYTLESLDYEYNTHKFENGRNFYGYWCWEAGALVKIKGLDDSILRNNQFYPYDFVHWKDQDTSVKQSVNTPIFSTKPT
ncbi:MULTISPECIES: PoNe immunity protein domain-containing protein [unclassified Gilliamella]|uniref:PoNe immunity protein domain-containing protein n=1 Tax=unclassified Gilliamella TaxID=2685620 RepID=UPI0013059652|nr:MULTISPECIES: PoNe immunity protein domain-containing protein [unclassified Gilliamella]MWP50325.1 DUF1911 domain-containing protein [Gilliamella sp. Lep-s35]MWP70039.1 DUF1911 domain-containing protein [Gilliamella sp. Lep-s5]MWP78286.1 DUF1911 domain-containing protein [Gilliamella sp. Lep-s21]